VRDILDSISERLMVTDLSQLKEQRAAMTSSCISLFFVGAIGLSELTTLSVME
jgi:hypothetical protein